MDYAEDQRIGKTILATTTDAYRKLRNTLRYLLGALADFTEAERVAPADMPPLERLVPHRLAELDRQCAPPTRAISSRTWSGRSSSSARTTCRCCSSTSAVTLLLQDQPDSLRRRAARTVMDLAFERITAWLGPLIPFTTEEAWTLRFSKPGPTPCA